MNRDLVAAIAFRAALVRMSFSAGGSAYLTEQIKKANEAVRAASEPGPNPP